MIEVIILCAFFAAFRISEILDRAGYLKGRLSERRPQ